MSSVYRTAARHLTSDPAFRCVCAAICYHPCCTHTHSDNSSLCELYSHSYSSSFPPLHFFLLIKLTPPSSLHVFSVGCFVLQSVCVCVCEASGRFPFHFTCVVGAGGNTHTHTHTHMHTGRHEYPLNAR